ncbi:serine hydrolase [Acrocarpospora catenulata]|uniref:serine hydrolase n=1 Tax=Acrocarpospora catenulata TaxID=2836182 RepID=UPI001BDA64C2|nr:serine hydrolase [Acrocarpospora catenulata]
MVVRRWVAAGLVLVGLVACGTAESMAAGVPRVVATQTVAMGLMMVPEERSEPVLPVDAQGLTKRLRKFLKARPGRVSAAVEDLATGRVYRFRPKEVLPTASTAKVGILMALLRKRRWDSLSAQDRHDANIMIRYSDNKAADRLWERIGKEAGLTRANQAFKLKNTTAIGGKCVDLYCWGITRTTAVDQVRLMKLLSRKSSPVKDHKVVLKLMRDVVADQKWGVSAGACEGEPVALKNGWLKHVANDQWVIVSAGLIANRFAVAVLTEDNATSAAGIAKVEGIVTRMMDAFRACPPTSE